MVLKIGKHCPRDLIYTEYNTEHTKSIQNVIQSTHNTIQTSYNTGHTKSTLNIIQGHSKCIQNIIQNTQDWFRDKWGRRWGKALSSRWPSWSAICPRAPSSIHTSPVACSYLDRLSNSRKARIHSLLTLCTFKRHFRSFAYLQKRGTNEMGRRFFTS